MTVSLAQNIRHAALGATLLFATVAGGCSGDGSPGFFQTGALSEAPVAATSAKTAADPVCVSMAAQIEKLRQDGSVGRLEKAADGKTPDVTVKRATLATQAQLNKANSDFIAKCGPSLPKPAMTAAVPPVAPAAIKPAAAKVAQAAAKVAEQGVTVAPPPAAPKQ